MKKPEYVGLAACIIDAGIAGVLATYCLTLGVSIACGGIEGAVM